MDETWLGSTKIETAVNQMSFQKRREWCGITVTAYFLFESPHWVPIFRKAFSLDIR